VDAGPAGIGVPVSAEVLVSVGVGVPVSAEVLVSVGVGVPVSVAVSVGVASVLMVGDSVLAVGVGARVGAGAIVGGPTTALLTGRLKNEVGSIPMGPVLGPVFSWAEEWALDRWLVPAVLTELVGVIGRSTRPTAKAPATTMATALATASTGLSQAAADSSRLIVLRGEARR
jgi:hypothetical protein